MANIRSRNWRLHLRVLSSLNFPMDVTPHKGRSIENQCPTDCGGEVVASRRWQGTGGQIGPTSTPEFPRPMPHLVGGNAFSIATVEHAHWLAQPFRALALLSTGDPEGSYT